MRLQHAVGLGPHVAASWCMVHTHAYMYILGTRKEPWRVMPGAALGERAACTYRLMCILRNGSINARYRILVSLASPNLHVHPLSLQSAP